MLLASNFNGGFKAFDVFIDVIINHFENNHIEYRFASSVDSAINYIQNETIDFSINIGLYKYFIDGVPLYEKHHVHNYQWIMDNPLKLNLDYHSKYNHLIFIDEDFNKVIEEKVDALTLPMIFPDLDKTNASKKDAILAPLKIRDLLAIKDEIEHSEEKDNVYSFINSFDYDKSYIDALIEYLNTHHVKNKEQFFRLTNSYIRTDKRMKIINSIHSKPIYLLSSQKLPLIDNPNVIYIEAYDFDKTLELMKEFKYVLTVSPNYDKALHERVGYALSSGAIVIADKTSLLDELHFPGRISYHELDKIDEIIKDLDENTQSTQWEIIQKYDFYNIFNKILEHYLRQK